MTTVENTLLESIRYSLRNGTLATFRTALVEASSFTFRKKSSHPISDDFVDHFLKLVNTSIFLHHSRSSEFLVIVEYDWGRFTKPQRKRIFAVLVSKFGIFSDPTSNYLVSELLGSHWANKAAFDFLNTYSKKSDSHCRELAICGLVSMMRYGCKTYRLKAKKRLMRESGESLKLANRE